MPFRPKAIVWSNDGLPMHICITQPQWVNIDSIQPLPCIDTNFEQCYFGGQHGLLQVSTYSCIIDNFHKKFFRGHHVHFNFLLQSLQSKYTGQLPSLCFTQVCKCAAHWAIRKATLFSVMAPASIFYDDQGSILVWWCLVPSITKSSTSIVLAI